MDKRAAEQYLDKIFGKRAGHVAVAYKDKGQSWQEKQFTWPRDRSKLLGWAEVHHDANIFICPALRKDAHTRKKGDMQPTRWLWADVDWQSVPAEKQAAVHERIREIGSYVVASGSSNNAHVYVQLDRPVPHDEHAKLNTGLRDYLYGDNKQADNSLLRLPGTTNWKTPDGSPVAVRADNDKKFTPANLRKRRAFRDAKVAVDADATDWDFVEVELTGRLRRMVSMPVEEALGRYSKRHTAVAAITKELHKRGFDNDQIHSLMHTFPAGVDKMAEENGYDLHLDIDRCLARISVVEEAEQIVVEAEDDMPPIPDEEFFKEAIEEGVAKELLRRSIKKAADIEEAERGWVGPPPDISWSLSDGLKNPPKPVPHLIGAADEEGRGLAGAKHNVLLTAQYKSGKTKFIMANVASAVCDAHDFLDRFPVNVPDEGAVVGHWNCEMDPDEMLDDYIRPVGIKNTDNLHVANLRGYRVDIRTPLGKQWAVDWLKTRNVRVWTIDSFARLARMANVSEKDNDEVMGLLMALDEIKVEAGVDVLFLITHTGRAEMEEGKERARGATAIDDWADARWIMVKVNNARTLRVEGRGVALDETTLIYDEPTGRSTMGFGGRAEIANDTGKDAVVKAVKDNPGMTKTELKSVLKTLKIGSRAADGFIDEAIIGDFIEVREDSSGRGKPAQRHYLAGSLKGETRNHRATPGVVDTRGVRLRSRA